MLIRTPQPHSHRESLLGYILRVAEANGYDSPKKLLIPNRLGGSEGKSTKIDVKKLAQLVGCDVSSLVPMMNFPKNSDKVHLLGRPIHGITGYSMLRLKSPALCPHCVAETGFIHASWDLSLVTACAKHGCALIDKCHVCQKNLTYYRSGLLVCDCEADLRDAPAGDVSPELIEFTKIVVAKANGESLLAFENVLNFPIEFFESLSLEDFVELMRMVIKFAAPEQLSVSSGHTSAFAKTCIDVFKKWPAGLHRLIQSMDTRVTRSACAGVRPEPRFKNFYAPMFSAKNRIEKYRFIHDEFIRFNRTELPESLASTEGNAINRYGEHWVSITRICQQWGISATALEDMLSKVGAPTKSVSNGKQTAQLVNVAWFGILHIPMPESLTGVEAAVQTGIPTVILHALRKIGILNKVEKPVSSDRFDTRDIDSLIHTMLMRAPIVSQRKLNFPGVIRLDDILDSKNPAEISGKADFIASYLNGKTRALGRFDDALGSICFDLESTRIFRHSLSANGDPDYRNYRQTAALIDVPASTIAALIDARCLDAAAKVSGRPPGVTPDSIFRFSGRWKSIGTIALEFNAALSVVLRSIDAIGLPMLIVESTVRNPDGTSDVAKFLRLEDVDRLKKIWATKSRYPKGQFENPIQSDSQLTPQCTTERHQ